VEWIRRGKVKIDINGTDLPKLSSHEHFGVEVLDGWIRFVRRQRDKAIVQGGTLSLGVPYSCRFERAISLKQVAKILAGTEIGQIADVQVFHGRC
jgi:hypothetical protein